MKTIALLLMFLNVHITLPEDKVHMNFSDYWIQKCRFMVQYEETMGGTVVHIKMNCNNR